MIEVLVKPGAKVKQGGMAAVPGRLGGYEARRQKHVESDSESEIKPPLPWASWPPSLPAS
jgi:hypothetical protein